MRKLKVVCSQHQDHKRKRGMHFDPLRQTHEAVATWLEGVFPDGAPAIQTIFDKANAMAQTIQFVLEDPRPALFEWKPLARVGNDSPGQRIAVDKNLKHPNSPGKLCGF
jgi:hypothetical protein